MGVCSGRLKKGVLGAGTARKRGVLGAGPTRKKGGLRCGSGQKKGIFTAAHTYTEHICSRYSRCNIGYITRNSQLFELLVNCFLSSSLITSWLSNITHGLKLKIQDRMCPTVHDYVFFIFLTFDIWIFHYNYDIYRTYRYHTRCNRLRRPLTRLIVHPPML